MQETGPGLLMVTEIVNALNGTITLGEPARGGCSFKVIIPKVNQEREGV